MSSKLLTVLIALALLATSLSATSEAPASAAAADSATAARRGRPAVIGERVIGHSVQGRPIRAFHLGWPRKENGRPSETVMLIAEMHGNEQAPAQILRSLVDGQPIGGVNLWVVPTYNPDGVAANNRHNAHGVDPNRNYPYHWAPLSGNYYSGPHAGSEPETQAMMRFLRRIRPDVVLSFHQPLNGVDTDTKRPRLAQHVAKALGLPTSNLDCGGVCHGTMTGWYNANFPGTAFTIEYGYTPTRQRMTVQAPRALLRVFHANHGVPHAEPYRG